MTQAQTAPLSFKAIGYAMPLSLIPLAMIMFLPTFPGWLWMCSALAGAFLFALFIYLITLNIRSLLIRRFFVAFSVVAISIFQWTRWISFYVQGTSFNRQFFFHFDLGSLLNTGTAFLPLFAAVVLFLSVVAWMGWKQAASIPNQRNTKLLTKGVLLLLPLAIAIEPDLNSFTSYSADRLLAKYKFRKREVITEEALTNLGLNSKAINTQTSKQASAGKNLILIYLESLEYAFTDPAIFPGLTPNINNYKEHARLYRNLKQTEGTSWTIAGIVATQCGTPLISEAFSGGNDLLQNGFLQQADCLGDILSRAGYRQHYLGGAAIQFAGKQQYLVNHGYDIAEGYFEIKDSISEADYEQWGLYDDALFRLAIDRIRHLDGQSQPYNMTLLTLDTHIPGRPSPSCPKYRDGSSSDLNAVHCTDYLLGKLISELQDTVDMKRTVVALVSDHLAFASVSSKFIPDDYSRELLFMVVNGNSPQVINSGGTHMDVAPSILDEMGVRHNSQFLAGRSLNDNKEQNSDSALALASDRLNAIKKINSTIFSPAFNVCSSKSAISVINSDLVIGGKPVTLSESGWERPLQALGTEYGYLALLDNQGFIIAQTMPDLIDLNDAFSEMLINAAANKTGGHILAIAPSANQWPFTTRTIPTDSGKIATSLIRTDGEIIQQGFNDNPETIEFQIKSCPSIMQTTVASASYSGAEPASNCAERSYYNPSNQRLYLKNVRVGTDYFDAELKQGSDGNFTLESYETLNESDISCSSAQKLGNYVLSKVEVDNNESLWILKKSGIAVSGSEIYRRLSIN